jgi:tetratricopeptide (TPR) repeat protein
MGNRQFAERLMQQAVEAATVKGKPSDLTSAYQLWASACMADPTYAQAWYQYANNNFELKKPEAALAGYVRALECDTDDKTRATILCNQAWAYYLLGRIDDAYEANHQAGKLDLTLAQHWLHKAVLEGLRGNNELAVSDAELAVALAEREYYATLETEYGPVLETIEIRNSFKYRQLLEARICLAFCLLFDGQYQRGLELFELRFEWRLHHFLQLPYPRWTGAPGKTIFLVSDQGLGDTLSYARFVDLLCARCQYVHAYIQPVLMRTFMNALGHIPNLNLIPAGGSYPQADYWTTFVSLPYGLGLTDKVIRQTRQIVAPNYPLPTTWMVPDTELHIGIAWAGSPLNDVDVHRNIPVEQFLDLYRVPGIQLYGLQIGDRNQENHQSGSVSLIRDLSSYINDVADTVSILRNLDLVICCESALGHICALAGKECWIAYSYEGHDYRIGHRGEKLLWTPRHRIFQQDPDGQWQPVFEKIVNALKERLRSKHLARRREYDHVAQD